MKLLRHITWLILIPGLILGFAGCADDDDDGVGGGGVDGTSISGTITRNLTSGGSPYVMNGDVLVAEGETLTIDPGVEILVNGNYTFRVEGTLQAEGSELAMIHFTSAKSNPGRGDWRGIWLDDADDNSVLRYVKVSYAGRYNLIADTSRTYLDSLGYGVNLTNLQRGSITIQDCSPVVERCIVELGGYDGIHVLGDADPVIQYNTIVQNAFNGIRVEPDWELWWSQGRGIGEAVIRNNVITDNDDAGIRLPDVIDLINAGLNPTTEYNDIWGNVSPDYVPPSWELNDATDVTKDIHVDPIYVDFELGDYRLHACSGVVDKGAPDDPTDPDGTRADVGALPLYQGEYDLAKTLTGDKLTLSDNVYHVTCDVVVEEGDVLTIAPGAQILFDGAYSLTIRGTINAVGTNSSPILFSSGQETPHRGDWRQLVLDNVPDESILENVILEYASMERLSKPEPDTVGALSLIGCSPTLTDITIREAYYSGLFCYNGSNPVVDGITVEGVGVDGITVKLNSSPRITRARVSEVQGYGMHFANNSSAQVTNALVYDAAVVGIVIEDNSAPTLDFVTVYGDLIDIAASGGYSTKGIRVSRYCVPSITNSIIAEYAEVGIQSEVSTTVTLSHVNIFTNVSGSEAVPVTQGNVVYPEPLNGVTVFVDAQGGDFRVQSGDAKNAASDGTDLGAFGGSNPL